MLRNILNTLTGLALVVVAFFLFKSFVTPSLTPTNLTSSISPAIASVNTVSTSSTPVAIATTTSPTDIKNISIKKPASKPSTTPTKTPITAPVSTQTTVSAPINVPQTIPFDQINTSTRATLVNIICISSNDDLPSISGSGVIISPDGVIITNAHIGQYWLLQHFDGQNNAIDCTIRTGSPATASYKAKLAYISPDWIQNNSTVLTETDPTGTGENDYAFLKITSRIDGTPITTPLPYLAVNTDENIDVGDNILLASYPAEFFGSFNIVHDLYQTSAIGQVSHIYTFNKDTIDLINIPGTVVSQRGSSGGAAVNDQGQLTGIITTSSTATTTSMRDLEAITTAYINRDLIKHQNISLETLIVQADSISDDFNKNIAPKLTDILTAAIIQSAP